MTKTKRHLDFVEFMGDACMATLALALIYGLVAYAFFLTDDALRERQKKMDGCCAQCESLGGKWSVNHQCYNAGEPTTIKKLKESLKTVNR